MDTNMDKQHWRKTWTQAWTQTWTNMNANMDTHMDKNRDKNMETGMGKKHGDKHGQTTWTQAWTQKKELYFKVDLVFLFLTFWERNKKEKKKKKQRNMLDILRSQTSPINLSLLNPWVLPHPKWVPLSLPSVNQSARRCRHFHYARI